MLGACSFHTDMHSSVLIINWTEPLAGQKIHTQLAKLCAIFHDSRETRPTQILEHELLHIIYIYVVCFVSVFLLSLLLFDSVTVNATME